MGLTLAANIQTGGGGGALDSVDGANLTDGDTAYVINTNGFYPYWLDDDSAAAESSPEVISPDANAGDKRWLLAPVRVEKVLAANSDGLKLFEDGGTGIFVEDSTGFVGVLNTTPANALDVDGNIETRDGHYVKTDKIRARDGDGLYLVDDGDNGMFIADGGDVIISTNPISTPPLCRFQIEGGNGVPSLSAENGILLIGKEGTTCLEIGRDSASPYPLFLQGKKPSTDAAFPVTIQPVGGYTGFGERDPDRMVHVYHATDDVLLKVESGDAGALIEFWDGSTATAPQIGASGDDYTVKTGGSTVFLVDSSGQVGINKTSGLQEYLNVDGNIGIISDNASILVNVYYDGGWKYYGNGFCGSIKLSGSDGHWLFFTGAENSSGAGAAATNSVRLVLSNEGSLGLGANNTDFDGGVGVFSIDEAGTNPDENGTTGPCVMWVDGGDLFAVNSSGTKKQITNHAKTWPSTMVTSSDFPAVGLDSNKYLGKRRHTAWCKIAELVQQLARNAGLLATDEEVVHIEDTAKQALSVLEQKRKDGWAEKNQVVAEISKTEAIEDVEVEIEDEESEPVETEKTVYVLNEETGEIEAETEIVKEKRKIKVVRKKVKKDCWFDENDGRFFTYKKPSKTAIEAARDEWDNIPDWIRGAA